MSSSIRPATSTWAGDPSDEDEDDTTRLLKDNRNKTTYEAIKDHEEGLEKLGKAIKRQKYVANEMATEVDLHNEILDGIDTGMTNATQNLQKNTRNIKLVMRKSSTFYLWMLIVILAVVIVLLQIF